MSEQKDLTPIAPTKREVQPVRFRHFKVYSGRRDLKQFNQTTRAFQIAGMTFEIIASAAEGLGYQVERGQLDAPLSQAVGQLKSVGEMVESQGMSMAWQNRGEVIEITPQLSGPNTGQTLVITPQSLNRAEQGQNKIKVLEGIAVFEKKVDELENNPYLQVPTDLKKAA